MARDSGNARFALRMRWQRWLRLASCVILTIAATAHAQSPEGPAMGMPDSFSKESLPADFAGASATKPAGAGGAELLLFQDIPVVVSAARNAQPVNMLSVPVSIVSAEDIHYSGLTTIPEVLEFVPGMDVLKIDRNNYAVGVRGLHHTFADRTLTLINGRDATNPGFGGADLQTLPVLMEDIERIEVVRGPGGAAWGANAFNGVINIITKRPEDVRGLMASTTIDHFGDTYNYLRWADKSGDWAWRISLGYEDRKSSGDAVGNDDVNFQSLNPALNPLIGFDNISTNDFQRAYRLDAEAAYHISETTRLSFGVASAHIERGDLEILGATTSENAQNEPVRAFARLEYKPDADTTGYLQWFGNYEHMIRPAITDVQTLENDLEGQMTFLATRDNKLTIGGNARLVRVEADGGSQDLLHGQDFDEQWAGAFVIDRWQATDRLAIEGQGRIDWYSETGVDWSGRLSALYAADDKKHHVLRLSAAKAFRAPLVGVREASGERIFMPVPGMGPLPIVTLRGNEELGNEEIYSFEAGYNGQLSDALSLRIDGYYQQYQDLIGARRLADPLGLGREFDMLDNVGGAGGYGAETELAYTTKSVKASVWYAYNGITLDGSTVNTRSFLTAKNKVGATFRWFIGDGWTFNGNYRYSDKTRNDLEELDGQIDARSSHRLDLAIAKSLFKDKAELMFGVADVFDDTRSGVFQDGSFTTHDTPGRTFFVRLQAQF